MSTVRNEENNLPRQLPDKLLGERSRDATESTVGVEERRPGVETDPHRLHDATAAVRWSVVIPTRAGWENLSSTLPGLLAALGVDDEVVVVGDGCDVSLPGAHDPRCRVAVHVGASGFAPACNTGARESRGALLLFLNDDVAVVPDLLDRLREELGLREVGAVGPNVLSQRLGRSESGTTLTWHHGVLEARQGPLDREGRVNVPYLCGAALGVRRGDFLALGGFDERLAPFFWEDVDLSLRVREQVKETVVAEGVTVVHRHGATVGKEPERLRRAIYERNRLLVTWRHLHGRRWLSHLGWLPLRLAGGLLHDRAVVKGFVLAVGCLLSGRGARAGRR